MQYTKLCVYLIISSYFNQMILTKDNDYKYEGMILTRERLSLWIIILILILIYLYTTFNLNNWILPYYILFLPFYLFTNSWLWIFLSLEGLNLLFFLYLFIKHKNHITLIFVFLNLIASLLLLIYISSCFYHFGSFNIYMHPTLFLFSLNSSYIDYILTCYLSFKFLFIPFNYYITEFFLSLSYSYITSYNLIYKPLFFIFLYLYKPLIPLPLFLSICIFTLTFLPLITLFSQFKLKSILAFTGISNYALLCMYPENIDIGLLLSYLITLALFLLLLNYLSNGINDSVVIYPLKFILIICVFSFIGVPPLSGFLMKYYSVLYILPEFNSDIVLSLFLYISISVFIYLKWLKLSFYYIPFSYLDWILSLLTYLVFSYFFLYTLF